jgi:hypothetical protein
MCNLVVPTKVYEGDLYNMYLEQNLNFTTNTFWAQKHPHEMDTWSLILDSNIYPLKSMASTYG